MPRGCYPTPGERHASNIGADSVIRGSPKAPRVRLFLLLVVHLREDIHKVPYRGTKEPSGAISLLHTST